MTLHPSTSSLCPLPKHYSSSSSRGPPRPSLHCCTRWLQPLQCAAEMQAQCSSCCCLSFYSPRGSTGGTLPGKSRDLVTTDSWNIHSRAAPFCSALLSSASLGHADPGKFNLKRAETNSTVNKISAHFSVFTNTENKSHFPVYKFT